MDRILISRLELSSHIGITAEEQDLPQRLTVNLEIEPRENFTDLEDNLARTVDYASVSLRIKQLALERPRNLLETLAGEIAGLILQEFAVARVSVELRKYILPDTKYVAVCITRPIPDSRP